MVGLIPRTPPRGYVVIDAARWAASSFLSDSEIRDLAENGLRKIGLKVEREWLEEQGQEPLGLW